MNIANPRDRNSLNGQSYCERKNGRTLEDELKNHTKIAVPTPQPFEWTPEVSVVITTYNHADFIEKCINTVLNQQTNFLFEVIICDDDSSDNTASIVDRFASRFSNIIRLYKGNRANNISVAGQATGRYNAWVGISLAKGRYIAYMDGDDFWHDPTKLQRQYDFLEANSHYSMCFTLGQYLLPDGQTIPCHRPSQKAFSSIEYLQLLSARNLSSSRFVRTSITTSKIPIWFFEGFSDKYWDLWASCNGLIGWIDSDSTMYRIHKKGMWQGGSTSFRRNLQFERQRTLLKNGEEEKWMRHRWLKTEFFNYLRTSRYLDNMSEYGIIQVTKLLQYGAVKHLTAKWKVQVLIYAIYCRIIISSTQFLNNFNRQKAPISGQRE